VSKAFEDQALYIVDYSKIKLYVPEEHRIEGRYLAEPIALFVEQPVGDGEKTKLMPIAISLSDPHNFWFEPPSTDGDISSAEYYSWLLAKMHFATADALFHEFGPHLTRCHLISESIMIATYQTFPKEHPIFKLLKPHFKSLPTINFVGIRALLDPGNIVDQIMSGGRIAAVDVIDASFDEWKLLENCPVKNDIRKRGLEHTNFDFPYRDDALLFYEVLHNFVTDLVQKIYPTPSILQQDQLLQGWWKLLSSTEQIPGSPSLNFDRTIRFPQEFPTSCGQLADVLTAIIWTASAQHTAVNNGQVDFCSFIPNSPMLHHQPVPITKEQVDDNYIIKSLPSLQETLQQLGFMFILTNKILLYESDDTYFKPEEKHLNGVNSETYLNGIYGFTTQDFRQSVINFSHSLEELENKIKMQQQERCTNFRRITGNYVVPITVEYPYLLPSRTNLSITN